MNDYVDVFISHKQEDIEVAQQLCERIQLLGYQCYLDVADSTLSGSLSAGELATRIRSTLRRSKCLIFLYTNRSVDSKWMPWELGFFDGRWGSQSIGLYLHDITPSVPVRDEGDSIPGFTIQEYLDIYEQVTDETLPAFLQRATSNDVLANRSDVDIDRFMTLLGAAARNPVAFQIGWGQYLLGTLQPFASVNPILDEQLDRVATLLNSLRSMAQAWPAGNVGKTAFDPTDNLLNYLRQAHVGGVKGSGA